MKHSALVFRKIVGLPLRKQELLSVGSQQERKKPKLIVKRDGEEGPVSRNNLMRGSSGFVSSRTGEREKGSRTLPRFMGWHLELVLVPFTRLWSTEGKKVGWGRCGGGNDEFCLAYGKFRGPGAEAVLVETGLGCRQSSWLDLKLSASGWWLKPRGGSLARQQVSSKETTEPRSEAWGCSAHKEKVSWETKKGQPKKWKETQKTVLSHDAVERHSPQREFSQIHPE